MSSTFAFAQDFVEIGDGSTSSYRTPVNNFYQYSRTQSIYLQTDLGIDMPVNLTKIGYNLAAYDGDAYTYSQIQIWMGHTTMDQFTGTGDWVDVSTLQLVYDGPMSYTGPGWIELELDDVFAYNGTDNLIITVADPTNSPSYPGSGNTWSLTDLNNGVKRVLMGYSDSTNPPSLCTYCSSYEDQIADLRVYYEVSGDAYLEGTVTDAVTGDPLNGAKVTVGDDYVFTGQDGMFSFVVNPGNRTVTTEKPGYATQSQTVAAVIGEPVVVDFAMEEEVNMPVGVYAFISQADVDVVDIQWGAPGASYEIIYDDGEAENYAVWVQGGNMNALRFTPAGYPCDVLSASIYVGDGSYPQGEDILQPFEVAVYDATGADNLPGAELGRVEVTPEQFGWIAVDFASLGITIESGDFYVAMIQGGNYPECLALGVDESNPVMRSYSRNVTNGQGWTTAGYTDFMMRAVCEGPAGVVNMNAADVIAESKPSAASLSMNPPVCGSGEVANGIYKAVEGGNTGRGFTNYSVYRFNHLDINNMENWTLLGNTTNLNYRDNAWPSLEAGLYHWAVVANYSNNSSEPAISNYLSNNFDYEVTVEVTTTDGESAEGAIVTMVSQAHNTIIYQDVCDANGTVVFTEVWNDMYDLSVNLTGYDLYTDVVTIDGDMTIEVLLQETLAPPRALYVDAYTLLATWVEPGTFQPYEVDFNNGFPEDLEVNDIGGCGGWFLNGAYSGFSSQFARIDSDANGNGCHDIGEMVTPVLNTAGVPQLILEFDQYYNNIGSDFARVDVWDGSQWVTVLNMTSDYGSWASPNHQVIDITNYANAGLKVRFYYDDGNSWAWYWAVDNIKIWDGMVETRGVTSYNFYLDGDLMTANVNATQYQIQPWMVSWGQEYTSSVEALYPNGISPRVEYTWTALYLAPPRNLEGEADGHYAHLTWEPPMIEEPAFEGTFPTVATSGNSSREINLGRAPQAGTPINKAADLTMNRGSIAYVTDALGGIFGTIDVEMPGTLNQIATYSGDYYCGDFGVEDENMFYVIDNATSQLKVADITSGVFTTVGSVSGASGHTWTGMAMDKSTGVMYAASTNGSASTIYTIDLATGATTTIGSPAIAGIIDIAIDGNGVMYATDIVSDEAFSIDKTTATATSIGALGINLNYAQGLGWDPATDVVYIAAYTTSAGLYILDRATGAAGLVGAFPAGTEICAFGFQGGGSGYVPENLIAYNIYENGAYYDQVDAETTEYTTDYLIAGWHSFTVTAVYGEPTPGESAHEGPVDIYILGQGTLYGVVSECGTLPTPIAGATVTAINPESGDEFMAVTDNSGNYSMEVIEGTYDVTVVAEDYVSGEALGVFVPDEGSYEQNFELCEFPYPVIGVTAERNYEHTQVDVDWYAPMFFETIAYDDGMADDVTAWDKLGNINALRITPAGYPCEVMGAAVNIYDGSWPSGNTLAPFQIAIFDDNGADGMPGQMLEVVDVTPSANGWVEVFFDEAVIINDGEFYIGMIQGGDYPDCAPIAIDNSSSEMRSVSRYVSNNEAWKTADFQNFMMRAYVYNEADNRELEKYEVYRLLQGQEELPETWVLLSNNVMETEYVDVEWETQPQGWYRYAVKAVYTYNVSEPAFSNVVPNGFDSEITVNVRNEDGEAVEGAYVVLSSETDPDMYTYAATTPASGSVYFHEVWNGMYKLTVTREGYTDYILGGIYITSDNTFNVILQSLCLPPQNFQVNAQTGVATWLPPVVEYETVFEEGFEGGVIPPGWTQQYLVQNVSWGIGNGGPTGTPPNAHSGQYNATFMGSSATTKLITPAIDLAGALVPKLSFWHTQKAGAGQDELRVYYRTSATGSWVALASYIANIEVWQNETISLPNPSGSYYLAFEAQGPEPAGMGIALDDVKVMKGVAPGADSRALLGFNLYLDGQYVDYTTDYTYTYTGLEIEQTYIAGITAEYTSCTSVMVNYAFTYMPCYLFNPPTNFNGVANPGNQVALTWDLPEGADDREATVIGEEVRTNVPANAEGSPMVREIEVSGNRDMWDLQFNFACGDASGEAGAETDGAKFYTTKWNGSASLGTFFSYEMDGTFNGSFEISGCGNVRDLAYDGEYFYGADATAKIWQMDFDAQTLVSTLTAPAAVRAIAYDDDQDAFYINNWSETVQLVDRSGAVINSWPVGSYGSYYGMAYDNFDPEAEPSVWCFSQDGSGGVLVQNNAETGAWTGMMWDAVAALATSGTDLGGGLFTHENIVAGTVTLGGIIQNISVFGYELYGAGGGGGGSDFVGFNVYRDGLKLTPAPISALGFNETITPGGEYTYNVTAVYEPNFESCPEEAEVTLCVGCDLDEPQCILAEVQESDVDVLVAWCTPGAVSPEYWISYFTDLTHLSWAAPERATLYNVTDFGAEYPVEVTQLSHMFYEHPSYPWGADLTFKFKVYAADGTTVLYESADVAALQYPDETIVVLTDAIVAEGDFYLAIAANPETGMPSSAAIEDLTNSHGYVGEAGAWEAYELEWASRVKIRTAADEVMLQPNTSGHAVNVATDVATIDEPVEVRDLNRAILLGYNVWRNGDVITYVPAPDTFYMDMNLAPGDYAYCVTAIYDEGESTPICAEPVTVEAKGMIAGTVIDGMTGTVLNGVDITVDGTTVTTGYDGYYEMEVMSGMVEITAEKAGYTTSVKTAEVFYDQTTVVDFKLYEDGVAFMMPFYEPWDGGFEEQGWSFDPEQGNWLINETVGLDAPSAEFNWSPSVVDYSYALESGDIIGEGVTNVALAFDIMLSDYAGDGNEMLSVEVFDGAEWNEVVTFANTGNIDWTNYVYDISEYALGNIFSIRFVAHGLDSYNINYWNIDNVKVYEQVLVNVYGTVTEAATGNPVAGVEITVGDYTPVMTDGAGYYSLEVETGVYNFSAEKAGYNVINVPDVTVDADFEWSPELTAPTMVVNPDEIAVNAVAGGMQVIETATVENNGDGQLAWNVAWTELQMTAADNLSTVTTTRTEAGTPDQEVSPKVTKLVGAVDEIWDVQFEFDAAAAAGGVLSQAGVEFDGTYFYTTIWNGSNIMKYDMDGNFIGAFAIGGASSIRDLAWDGEYLYGGASSTTIYQIDPADMSVVGTISAPENVRAIAYDDAEDGFWICDWSTDLYLVGRDGAIMNVIANPGVESNYGMAYDGFTGAPSLWLFSQGGSGADFVQVDIATGNLTGVTHNALNDFAVTGTPIAGGAFTTVDYMSGTVTLGGLLQADQNLVFGYELAEYEQWLSFEPRNGVVMPGATQDVNVIFDAVNYPVGTHKEALATFYSNPNVGTEELMCIMDVIIGVNEVEGFEANIYPIPANDFVNIELNSNVQSIRILNYAGQVVYNQNADDTFIRIDVRDYTAGAYMVEFTTNDGEVFNKRIVVTK